MWLCSWKREGLGVWPSHPSVSDCAFWLSLDPVGLLSVEHVRSSAAGTGQNPAAHTQEPSTLSGRGWYDQLATAQDCWGLSTPD